LYCFLKRNYVLQTSLDNINPNNDEFKLIDTELYLGVGVMDLLNDPKVVLIMLDGRIFLKGKQNILTKITILDLMVV